MRAARAAAAPHVPHSCKGVAEGARELLGARVALRLLPRDAEADVAKVVGRKARAEAGRGLVGHPVDHAQRGRGRRAPGRGRGARRERGEAEDGGARQEGVPRVRSAAVSARPIGRGVAPWGGARGASAGRLFRSVAVAARTRWRAAGRAHRPTGARISWPHVCPGFSFSISAICLSLIHI